MENDRILTTKEAAAIKGVSQQRIIQLIWDGTIPADKFGNAWQIRESDLEQATWNTAIGRPKKKN